MMNVTNGSAASKLHPGHAGHAGHGDIRPIPGHPACPLPKPLPKPQPKPWGHDGYNPIHPGNPGKPFGHGEIRPLPGHLSKLPPAVGGSQEPGNPIVDFFKNLF